MQNKEAKFDKIPEKSDQCFQTKKFVKCDEPDSNCVSYANGKSGGRVSWDVDAFGPHRMKSMIEKEEPVKLDDLEAILNLMFFFIKTLCILLLNKLEYPKINICNI